MIIDFADTFSFVALLLIKGSRQGYFPNSLLPTLIKHRLIMTLNGVTATGTICVTPVVTITGAATATCAAATIRYMAWLTLMITRSLAGILTTNCKTNSRYHQHHQNRKSYRKSLLHNHIPLVRVGRNF